MNFTFRWMFIDSINVCEKMGDTQISVRITEVADFFPDSQHKEWIWSVIMTENMSQQSVLILQEIKTSLSPPAVANLETLEAGM